MKDNIRLTVGFYRYGATVAATRAYIRKNWATLHVTDQVNAVSSLIHLEIEASESDPFLVTAAMMAGAFSEGYEEAMRRFDTHT